MTAPENPYQPPQAEIEARQFKVGPGFFSYDKAAPVTCTGGTISLSDGYLRLAYVPTRFLVLTLKIYAVLTVLLIPFLQIQGAAGLALYVIIYSIFCVARTSKVQFELAEESLVVDRRRKCIGVLKTQRGERCFLGVTTSLLAIDAIMKHLPNHVEVKIVMRSKLKYHLTALLIWVAGLLGGAAFHQAVF